MGIRLLITFCLSVLQGDEDEDELISGERVPPEGREEEKSVRSPNINTVPVGNRLLITYCLSVFQGDEDEDELISGERVPPEGREEEKSVRSPNINTVPVAHTNGSSNSSNGNGTSSGTTQGLSTADQGKLSTLLNLLLVRILGHPGLGARVLS